MKKWSIFILIFITTSLFLIGCSSKKDVEFNEFYSQVIGFSKNIKDSKPIQQDSVLMMTNKDYLKFKDKYFTPRKIPIESPNKSKAVIYLQIPSMTFSVNIYNVQNISVKNNVITISLKKYSSTQVDPVEGFSEGSFKWVIFIEIDKTYLNDKMKIVVNT
jgi:hypothetical protein